MHKEEVVVTPRKPRASVRTSIINAEEESVTVNHTINIHSRLPSADSGIQADGGFDSLSRYKGKTFISTCSDQVSSDGLGASVGVDISGSSSGYSSDHSQGSFPLSAKARPASSSQPSVASSKPVPPAKPNLTSSPSKRSSATACGNSSQILDIKNVRTAPKVKPPSPPCLPPTSPVKLSGAAKQQGTPAKSTYVNHNITSTKPVVPKRTELGSSVTNNKSSVTISTNQNSDGESVSMFPSVKLVTSETNVQLSISNGAISSSENPSSSPPMTTSATTVVNRDTVGSSIKPTESNPKGSATTNVSSGSAVQFHVVNPARRVQAPADNPRNQGQGCVTLTRPLKLGAPAKLTVKTVQTTTLNAQPAHLIPVQISSSQEDDKHRPQQQPQVSPARAKPKIAPRPSVLAKAVSTQPTLVTTTSIVTATATTADNGTTAPNLTRKNSTKSANSSQPTAESFPHKVDSSVVHRVKTAVQTGRTEIPVTHIVHRAPSYKNQLHSRPTSFNRHTPEREKHKSLHEQQLRQPIYENIRFHVRDGFDFDDVDTKMKHAELVLKRSDELINDALRMFAASPVPHEGGRSSAANLHFGDGVRIVEGAESSPPKEHRIPIFDARTGKLHSGTSISSFLDGPSTRVASCNGDVQAEVTWKQRKERINSALSYLKQELAGLRDMDSTLISQFKRCQETIETLKTQRDVWEGLSEEGEEGEYWDDYELNEYNRRYLDSPGGSSSSQFSPGSREPSLQDVTLISFPVPQLSLPDEDRSLPVPHAITQDRSLPVPHVVKQDIEATL
ncbi:hypothetical protein BsWGS_24463 [Bradybaena similaris]